MGVEVDEDQVLLFDIPESMGAGSCFFAFPQAWHLLAGTGILGAEIFHSPV
jgi:hypothetical protein